MWGGRYGEQMPRHRRGFVLLPSCLPSAQPTTLLPLPTLRIRRSRKTSWSCLTPETRKGQFWPVPCQAKALASAIERSRIPLPGLCSPSNAARTSCASNYGVKRGVGNGGNLTNLTCDSGARMTIFSGESKFTADFPHAPTRDSGLIPLSCARALTN